jgi:RNA polymerase sigma factor (sigma-70 family)
VLLGSIRRRGKFELRDQRALGAYLRKAVQNHISDEHRRRARRRVGEIASDDFPDAMPSPLERAMTAEMWDRYHAALACLSPRERELIVAHVELGYSHKQLGCMIGRSPNAARMALQRAVRRLAKRMAER